jgi:alpha-galactosidase
VNTFAGWGVDGIIADCCGSCRHWGYLGGRQHHQDFSRAVLNAIPARPMYLQGDGALVFLTEEVGNYYNTWQAGSDHHDNWASTMDMIAMMSYLDPRGVAGAWPYMDVLMTGGQGCKSISSAAHCPGQTDVEYQTEFTMWALFQSPLLLGTNVLNLTSVMRTVLYNSDLIALHQNIASPPGMNVGHDPNCLLDTLQCHLYVRPMDDGSVFVVLMNSASAAHTITMPSYMLGWSDTTVFDATDLWTRRVITNLTLAFSASVQPHGVVAALLRKRNATNMD